MPAQYLETRDIPLAELTRFPGNARRGKIGAIRESVRTNGQYRSIVVRQCDNGQLIILAGNHTFDALGLEGHESARCDVVSCTDREARKINLADNRISDLATDDPDSLVELLSYLDEDYAGTGWSEDEVNRLIDPDLPEGFKEFDDDGDGGGSAPVAVACPSCGHSFDPRLALTTG